MMLTGTRGRDWIGIAVMGLALLSLPQRASALITGGEGNSPVRDPGWPEGAAAVFNAKARIAYWEGPPFGGGQWHAECRGNAEAFNEALADFAKMDAKSRRLVVHDGIGRSVWLNINNVPEKREAAKIDWSFVVWTPANWERLQTARSHRRWTTAVWTLANWERLQTLPERFRPSVGGDGAVPAPTIDVYVGGNIRWEDVRVPDGIEVVDERLEAHGFTLTDGTVLEGTVVDAANWSPLAAAAHLERIETKAGKNEYTRVSSVETDREGRWVLKTVPAGWFRVVVESPTYVARIAGYQQLDGSPHWASLPTALAQAAEVTGIVLDGAGAPLGDVRVQLDEVVIGADEVYRTSAELTTMTDAEGRFSFGGIPRGRTSVRVHKNGYVRAGLGEPIEVPAEGVSLTMQPAAHVRVKVDFGSVSRPVGYIVEMEPEGGNVVGSYGGSANLPEDNTYEFRNVPAGTYVFVGRPNPGSESEETDRVKAELRGGETTTVTLKAK